jgi:hypothetical protein
MSQELINLVRELYPDSGFTIQDCNLLSDDVIYLRYSDWSGHDIRENLYRIVNGELLVYRLDDRFKDDTLNEFQSVFRQAKLNQLLDAS